MIPETSPEQVWDCGSVRFFPVRRPVVMGILNVTPDSFSDAGSHLEPAVAEARALEMVAHGADIIDIGGESTRPDSDPVPEEEELRRVLPVLHRLATSCRVPLSIDTVKPSVARAALNEGATIINDVGGCTDPAMLSLLVSHRCGYVLMHSQGSPKTMQLNPRYHDVVAEVSSLLDHGLHRLAEAGVAQERVVLDPGFGFGKTWRHNRDLLLGLPTLTRLGRPVLAGISRKSFIGKVTATPEHERDGGSVAAETLALWHGATILRTHRPDLARQAAALATAVARGSEESSC